MSRIFLKSGFGLGGFLPHAVPPPLRSQIRHSHSDDALTTDERWMREALCLAMPKAGAASPNPCVGAIFVKDGQRLSSGATDAYGGLHGERVALAACADPRSLRGATLYVGLEPCVHHGKQPPCLEALRDLGLSRCVIATADPHHLVQGAGIKALREAGVQVEVGVLGPEMRAWFLPFLAHVVRRRPIFVGKWAQTLNGLLADDEGTSQWLSGPTARAYTHHLRHTYDAIMVGSRTVLNDVPRLSVRDVPYAPTHQPLKILFDPNGRLLRLGEAQRLRIRDQLLADQGRVLYVTAEGVLTATQGWGGADWLTVGIEIADPFSSLVSRLQSPEVIGFHGKPIQSVMVEGGPRLLNGLWQEGLLDVAHVFIVPALLEGSEHRLRGFAPGRRGPLALQGQLSLARLTPLAANPLGEDILWEMAAEDLAEHYFSGSTA